MELAVSANNLAEETEVDLPLLVVKDLFKRYGPGCPSCRALTGPERGTNTCPKCGSLVACADVNFEVYPGEVLGVVG